MITSIRLTLVNPGWREVPAESALVFTTSPHPSAALGPYRYEDGVTLVLHGGPGPVTSIELYRSVTTSDQLYYHRRAGVLDVSDHFGCVVDSIPVPERQIARSALIDHALFRTTAGEGTYLDGVERVGHGSCVLWPVDRAAARTSVVSRIDRPGAAVSEATAEELLERRLGESVHVAPAGARNLLSGGVDSTLVQSFLPATRPISATIDSPEFASEASYALAAAALFGLRHELVELREADYEALLRAVIARSGLPPHHLQTVLVDASLGADAACYLTAQFADALFGLDAAYRAWRILRLRLDRISPLLDRAPLPWPRVRRFATRLRSDLAQLRLPPESAAGWGAQFAMYTQLDTVRQWFGAAAVTERLEYRRDYVQARMAPFVSDDHPFIQHLELGHWIDFFCDDTVTIWRQCAHSRGVALLAPFTARAVTNAALAVGAEQRFCAEGRTKPLLKNLLRRRVPTYPVNQSKGGSGLPLARYLRDGPLRPLAEEAGASNWPLPLADSREAPPNWLLWNQITLRLWDELVRRSPDRAPMAAQRRELATAVNP